MQIKLISPEDHQKLIKWSEDYPNLIFQNDGYEYINKSKLSEEELQAITDIEALLKNHITGFSKFFNYKKSKKGELKLRFDYNWGAADKSRQFIGVGYLLVDELLNGFSPEKKSLL
jgi:hypothetical protein